MKPQSEILEIFPARAIAWLVLFFLPYLYFFSELHATLLLEISGAAGAVYFGILLFTGRLRLDCTFKAILALLLTWLFLAARSIFISVDPSISWPVFVKAAGLATLCLGSAAAMAVSRRYEEFYRASLWAGLLAGLLALNEYVEAAPIPATWLDPASRELFRTRCAGIFTDPNIFAAYLAVIILLTLALVVTTRDNSQRLAASLALFWEGFAVFATLSRGGWIGLTAGFFAGTGLWVIGGYRSEKPARRALLVTTVLLLLVFFGGPFKMRLFSIGNPSDMTFAQRTLINRGIFSALNRLPIAGHGLHTFNQIYPRYRIVGGDYPLNAHNEFLHSMLETGFLSAIVLMLLCIMLIKAALRSRSSDVVFFAAAFITMFVHNLSGFSTRILPTAALISISAAGIMSFSLRYERSGSASRNRKLAIAMFMLACLIVSCGLSSFAWQTRIQNVEKLMAAGIPGQALTLIREMAVEDPQNPTVYAIAAMALQKLNDTEASLAMWQKAAKLNPGEAIFFIEQARLVKGIDNEAAEGHFRKALQLDPASEQFRLEFAQFLIAEGKRNEALAELRTGLTYSPGFHDVYTGFREIERLIAQLSR